MRRSRFSWRAWAPILLAGALLLDTTTTHSSESMPKHRVEIPAGELTRSLQELAQQLGIEILFDADRLKGIESSALSGLMTADEALSRVLEGTSLQAEAAGRESFLITSAAPQPLKPQSTVARPSRAPDAPLEDIVVTGTHIRGETPVGATLSTYDRTDFDRFGTATVDSLGRYMLENFSGADSLATLNTNGNVGSLQQGAPSNIFGGAGFDLLGLGPGATLTLLNGHRVAPGGLDGSMVDVSLIPLSAIDHVEVLTDGASALYGSDAIAGVVNIVARRPFEGAETSLRYGRSTEGGAGEFTGAQLLGHTWSSGNVLFDYEYDDNQGLDASQRSWIGPEGGPYSLIPENHRHSMFLTASQDLDQTALSLTGLYSTRGFRTDGIEVSTSGFIPASETGGGHANLAWVAVSADRSLPANWQASSTAFYSSMNQWRNGDDFPEGLMGPHSASALVADSGISGIDLSGSGRLIELPGGTVRLAVGGGLRSESFRGSVPSLEPLATDSQSRTNLNAYGELIAPLFGGNFSLPGLRRLEISLAYRTDHYVHVGGDSNPKWGAMWQPTSGLTVKGTYGTSFRAPLISQLDASTTSYTTLLPSATPGGKPTDVLVVNGGSTDLEPEKSKTYTTGIDWDPARRPRIHGSMTYFNIYYRGRIQSQNIEAEPLSAQPQLFSLTSLTPSLEQVLPFFQEPGFQHDGAGLGPSGVAAIIDNQLANEATTVEQGIRAGGEYTHEAGTLGRLMLTLSGSYLLVDRTSIEPYLPLISNVANTVAEPPKFRARGGLGWQWRSLTTDLTLNHTGAYQNTLFSPQQPISSWTTVDVGLKFEVPDESYSAFRGFIFVFNVQNLADRRPPYVAIPSGDLAIGRSAVPFDGTNASAIGRYTSIEIRKQW
jgi:iron complex outermembrane receptor protein